ncbi:MAG: glycosyltransferase, partial [Chthoniobacteraceae bacterium]
MTAGVDVSAILVSYNTVSLLPKAIDALQRASAGLSVETIIVDNASPDGSAEWIRRQLPAVRL